MLRLPSRYRRDADSLDVEASARGNLPEGGQPPAHPPPFFSTSPSYLLYPEPLSEGFVYEADGRKKRSSSQWRLVSPASSISMRHWGDEESEAQAPSQHKPSTCHPASFSFSQPASAVLYLP